MIKIFGLSINRILFVFVVTIVSIYGVNSSINPDSNYYNNNDNKNNPSKIPLILIATADGETSNRNDNNLESNQKNTDPYIGVNVRGLYTSLQHERYPSTPVPLPADYYNKSFKLISEAGMNHIRYVFYWEAYERNPQLFINELNTVANFADKWN